MTEYETRKCPVCDKEYQANTARLKHGRQTTCSRECSYQLRSAKLSNPDAPFSRQPSLRKCLSCEREFTSVHAEYCSQECRPVSPQSRVEKHCERCGKIFEVQSYRAESAKYCSIACQFPENNVCCDNCGNTFRKSPSAIKETNFCSVQCMTEFNTGKTRPEKQVRIEVQCGTCGKQLERQPNTVERNTNHYCSRECFEIAHRENMSGENNPAWRGGYEPYYGASWETQRAKALQRDNYTCQRCGDTENQLHVHHIVPLRLFNRNFEEAHDLSNLITYCRTCHIFVEWQENRSREE